MQAGNKVLNQKCEKNSYGSKREIFAVGRSIKWRNGTAENKRLDLKGQIQEKL